MRRVQVAGVGMTRFGKQPGTGIKSLVAEAVRDCLADAGLEARDVRQAYVGNAIGGSMTRQEMVLGQVALRPLGIEGVPVVNVENACASASTALHLAWSAVASGSVDVALAVGAEKMTHPDRGRVLSALAGAVDVEEWFGQDAPPTDRSVFMDVYAASARRYSERSGATAEDYAAVAVKNQGIGGANPRAQYGGDLTVADVLSARCVVDPLTVPMCSPISDGAAAVLLVSPEVAQRCGATVGVAASVLRSGAGGPDGPERTAAALAAEQAYEVAGLGPQDVHVVEVHDAAAPAEVSLYEELGLAPAGGGPDLLRRGDTRLGGRVPVNPSGGLLARGHPVGATGLAQVAEVVDQLRGRCGVRQVEGARVALTENGGGWLHGDNAAAAVHVFVSHR